MRHTFFIIIIIFSIGCVEEFNLDIDKTPPRLVVEGLITNQDGPYSVRLTKSNPELIYLDTVDVLSDNAIPIMDAMVIISDNYGLSDTLIPSPLYKKCIKYIFDDHYNIIDSILDTCENKYSIAKGFYETTNILGVTGRTYTLKIILKNNEEYLATSFMPELPPIDSLTYEYRILEKEKSEIIVPKIFFKDPSNQENYYLFQLITDDIDYSLSPYKKWNFSIISDRFLKSDVSIGLYIDDGASPNGLDYYIYPHRTIHVVVNMYSLTKEAYDFYNSLFNQFNNDGGAFSPAPSSPESNISNGAIGFFRASSVNKEEIFIER